MNSGLPPKAPGFPPLPKPSPEEEAALARSDTLRMEGKFQEARDLSNATGNAYNARSKELERVRKDGVALPGLSSRLNIGRIPDPPIKPPTRGGRTTRRVRRGGNKGGDIVCHLLTIRNQIKLYHWQTKQFSRHTATDALTAALDLNIDAFVESYMGRYGRPKVSGSIKLHNFSESAATAFVAKETKYLETDLPRIIKKTDTDLLNLRDTILAELTKVSYLFTLN
jgi:hypothetical protein